MRDVFTIRDLANKLGEPDFRIKYALNRYGQPCAGRIGNVRFWNASQLPDIECSLQRTAIRSRVLERFPVGNVDAVARRLVDENPNNPAATRQA